MEIAKNQRGLRHPRGVANGGEVRARQHVAVAEVVRGEPVAGHRDVVEVGGDEVVAILGAVFGDLFEKEPSGGALADEPTLQVGKRHHHRVDVAALDGAGQIVSRRLPYAAHPVT